MKKTTKTILATIVALTIVLVFTALLTSCNQNQPEAEVSESMTTDSEFHGLVILESKVILYENDTSPTYQHIMYDPETLVMYSVIANYRGSAITVLYNADGTPKLYMHPES